MYFTCFSFAKFIFLSGWDNLVCLVHGIIAHLIIVARFGSCNFIVNFVSIFNSLSDLCPLPSLIVKNRELLPVLHVFCLRNLLCYLSRKCGMPDHI